jgi:hypothetical protein
MHKLRLTLLTDTLAICRLQADAGIPDWAFRGTFSSVTRTAEELSIITGGDGIPADVTCDHDWRVLKVEGPLEFSLTGVLESVARPLADAAISMFAIATYNTDYVLVKSANLGRALEVLRAAGHMVAE